MAIKFRKAGTSVAKYSMLLLLFFSVLSCQCNLQVKDKSEFVVTSYTVGLPEYTRQKCELVKVVHGQSSEVMHVVAITGKKNSREAPRVMINIEQSGTVLNVKVIINGVASEAHNFWLFKH